ncbi:PRC-barrel domain-containing protein [Bradyrhizobium sp. 2]|uniref:PRC-barrel domain-containing protein n=1 Tax=Bradyrhizobium sp. 2 TaxID=190045 RepID=UPI001FF8C1BC|nr:PRC-barrel domain-containing protein [Bradyrhizobium sp. 2]
MINPVTIAVILAVTSSGAFAQPTNTSTAPPANAATQAGTIGNAASETSSGLRTADTANLAVRFVDVKPADFMTTKLIGANVYNNQKEKLGEIEDFAIENGREVTGVVVSVGGFLGIGESYVVLDPKTLVVNQTDGTWQAFVDTTKDTLKNAPKFSYSKKKT